jgi:hypothetical protein
MRENANNTIALRTMFHLVGRLAENSWSEHIAHSGWDQEIAAALTETFGSAIFVADQWRLPADA